MRRAEMKCETCGKTGPDEEIKRHDLIGLFSKGARVSFEVFFKNKRFRKSFTGTVANVVLSPGLVTNANSLLSRKMFYEVKIKAELRGEITIYVPEKNIKLAPRKWGQACTLETFENFVRKEFPDYIFGNIH